MDASCFATKLFNMPRYVSSLMICSIKTVTGNNNKNTTFSACLIGFEAQFSGPSPNYKHDMGGISFYHSCFSVCPIHIIHFRNHAIKNNLIIELKERPSYFFLINKSPSITFCCYSFAKVLHERN